VINRQTGAWLATAGVPAEKIKLIPAFYIDLDIFKPLELEKQYDLIFVGRRATNKGIELFEEAAQRLGASSIIVDGWAADAAQVAMLINRSKLLVMPSYNEGGPRVVLEAMACGVPVLATRVGIVPDVLPEDRIIDWSADDIAAKARPLLDRGIGMGEQRELIDVARRFEKRAALRRYAEAITQLL
jgi:glycosyltransferase involved in cell wall biosynthesis